MFCLHVAEPINRPQVVAHKNYLFPENSAVRDVAVEWKVCSRKVIHMTKDPSSFRFHMLTSTLTWCSPFLLSEHVKEFFKVVKQALLLTLSAPCIISYRNLPHCRPL